MVSEGNIGGIYKYSLELNDALRKEGIDLEEFWIKDRTQKEFVRIAKEMDRFDIVHIQHEYNLFGKWSRFFSKFMREIKRNSNAKIVFTMHSVRSQRERLGPIGILKKLVFRIMNEKILLNADKIIVHNENSKKILVEEYNFPKQVIKVVPMWIPRVSRGTKKRIFPGKINLLCWGFIQPHKNYDSIISIIPSLPGNICLEIVGSTHKSNFNRDSRYILKLERQIRKLKISDRVKIINKYLEDDELDQYLEGSDIILLLYKNITTSAVFFRSIAFKKKIITSDLPFFKEINKQTGFPTISNSENLKGNILRSIKSKKLSGAINVCFKKFNLNNISKKYLQIYLKLKKKR